MTCRNMTDSPDPGTAAAELRMLMREIAARAYRDGRQEHLEYVLWYALIHGPMRYGLTTITGDEIDRLRALSNACGGWYYVDREHCEHFVELAAWQDLFTRNFDPVQMR